jgi:hypothetical protein
MQDPGTVTEGVDQIVRGPGENPRKRTTKHLFHARKLEGQLELDPTTGIAKAVNNQ